MFSPAVPRDAARFVHIQDLDTEQRATLYEYFPNVEAILPAQHERHIAAHLARLTELGDADGEPRDRLEAVLRAYALICHHRGKHGKAELGALVHRGEPIARPNNKSSTLSRLCSARPYSTDGSATTSHPPSWRRTAFTRSPQPDACAPKQRCTASSTSPWSASDRQILDSVLPLRPAVPGRQPRSPGAGAAPGRTLDLSR